jgi:excisionase family DNA binding protein
MGAELATGDLLDRAAMSEAMRGVIALYAVTTPFGAGAEGEIEQGKQIIAAGCDVDLPWQSVVSGAVARTAAMLTRDEVMTAREVADLLRMPTSTVYELARKGVLPARRLGRAWRLLRPRLEELLAD